MPLSPAPEKLCRARRREFCGKRTSSYPQLWITLSANVDISSIYGLFSGERTVIYPQPVDAPCGFVDNLRRTASVFPAQK